MLKVSALYVTPVTSCRQIRVKEAYVTDTGLLFDHWFAVVNQKSNKVVRQKKISRMALIGQRIEKGRVGQNRLVLSAPRRKDFTLSFERSDGIVRQCVFMGAETYWAIDQGDDAARWLSEFLNGSYRLMKMPRGGFQVEDEWQGVRMKSFVFDAPFLVISRRSLADLNSHMDAPVPMDRFRPTLVVSGCAAYQEDRWSNIVVNTVRLRGGSLCVRCPITTIDQKTGRRGKEPMTTLARYRKPPGTKDVAFGRYFFNLNRGVIHEGDIIVNAF